MDPRKALLPLLWILLLKLEEDCCAEEGMCALGRALFPETVRRGASPVSLAHLRLSWGRKKVRVCFCRSDLARSRKGRHLEREQR